MQSRPLAAPIPRAVALALLCLVAAPACSGGSPAAPTHPANAEGARLYRTYCGLCHGDRGEGYAADNANALAHPDFLSSVDDAFLERAIVRGRPGTAMAAYGRTFGGPLDDAQVAALVAHLRSLQTKASVSLPSAPVEGDANASRPIFDRECAGCHGARGQGVNAISLNNPVFQETASDAQIRYAIAKGRRGTRMPAFEARLSAREIDGLVALVRTFTTPSRAARDPASAEIPSDLPIVVNPDGEAAAFELREERFVSSAQVNRALREGKRLVLLDARAPSDWLTMHLPGAVPCPYYAIDDLVERLPRDDTFIVAYCACPHAASGRVVDTLRQRGFEHTAVLDEGILVWRDLGYPVVEGGATGH